MAFATSALAFSFSFCHHMSPPLLLGDGEINYVFFGDLL